MLRPLLLATATLCAFATACDDGGFTALQDPEPQPEPEPTEPEPPPVFPLKAGDILVVPALGGRTEPCGVEGQCDRAIRATYEVKDVVLDSETNRWSINADYFYEMPSAKIETAAMAQLFISHAAPFSDLSEGGATDGNADFADDAAPTDTLTADGFPFFHYQAEYATRPDSAFAVASNRFTVRIQEIDPEANIENQAAANKLEAYFVDDLGATTYLHKIRVEYHPFGFICGWEERLIEYSDGMARNEGSCAGATIPIAAIFADPVRLTRGDRSYRCSCFTEQCKSTDGSNLCLDPDNPDADPFDC